MLERRGGGRVGEEPALQPRDLQAADRRSHRAAKMARPERTPSPSPPRLDAAANTPLHILNFVSMLRVQRDKILSALGPEGNLELLKRSLLKLKRMLSYLPDGSDTRMSNHWCHDHATMVLAQLGHHLRHHPSKSLFYQVVQRLEGHVLKAVAAQLARPEIQNALSDGCLSVDVRLAALICVSLLEAPGEYDADEILKVLRCAQPELRAEDAAEVLLRAEACGPKATYKILRHLTFEARETQQHFAVSSVLRFGYGHLDMSQVLRLLLLAVRCQAWLNAPVLLALCAVEDARLSQKDVELYEKTQRERGKALRRFLGRLSVEAKPPLLAILCGAERVYQQHLRGDAVENPFLDIRRPVPGTPEWMVPPPEAVAPPPTTPAQKKKFSAGPEDFEQTGWDALGIPDEGLLDHIRRRWHLLLPHQQHSILHSLAHHVLCAIYSEDDYTKAPQLELSALQVLLELGPDCLNVAEQLELMIVCSTHPALQARLVCAWVRLSKERRLLLPKFLQMLPSCRTGQQQADAFLELLPPESRASLDSFLEATHAAVPESVCQRVDYNTDGTPGLNFPPHHRPMRELAWRKGAAGEQNRVLVYVKAITEPPETAATLAETSGLKRLDHCSVLQVAHPLIEDERLLEETRRCLPLAGKEAHCLLMNLAFRAGRHLLQGGSTSTFPAEAFQLLLQSGERVVSAPTLLELMILACGDVYVQARLLCLWVRLSKERRELKAVAVKLWATVVEYESQASLALEELLQRFAALVPEAGDNDVITRDTCAKAHPARASGHIEILPTRKRIVETVWEVDPECSFFRPKFLQEDDKEEEVDSHLSVMSEAESQAEQTSKRRVPEAPQPTTERPRRACKSRRTLFDGAQKDEASPEPGVAQASEPRDVRWGQQRRTGKRTSCKANVPAPQDTPRVANAVLSADQLEPVVVLTRLTSAEILKWRRPAKNKETPAAKKPKVA